VIVFLLLAAAAVAAAVGVVTAPNAVHSVLWLIAHLCALAVLYLTLGATFLGLVQILIYAGAVMVLFLFVLGLLSTRGATDDAAGSQPAGLTRSAVTAALILVILLFLGAAGAQVWPAHAARATGVQAFAAALFGPYLLAFEATALALLIAVVGVVALSGGTGESRGSGLDVSHVQGAGSTAPGPEERAG